MPPVSLLTLALVALVAGSGRAALFDLTGSPPANAHDFQVPPGGGQACEDPTDPTYFYYASVYSTGQMPGVWWGRKNATHILEAGGFLFASSSAVFVETTNALACSGRVLLSVGGIDGSSESRVCALSLVAPATLANATAPCFQLTGSGRSLPVAVPGVLEGQFLITTWTSGETSTVTHLFHYPHLSASGTLTTQSDTAWDFTADAALCFSDDGRYMLRGWGASMDMSFPSALFSRGHPDVPTDKFVVAATTITPPGRTFACAFRPTSTDTRVPTVDIWSQQDDYAEGIDVVLTTVEFSQTLYVPPTASATPTISTAANYTALAGFIGGAYPVFRTYCARGGRGHRTIYCSQSRDYASSYYPTLSALEDPRGGAAIDNYVRANWSSGLYDEMFARAAHIGHLLPVAGGFFALYTGDWNFVPTLRDREPDFQDLTVDGEATAAGSAIGVDPATSPLLVGGHFEGEAPMGVYFSASRIASLGAVMSDAEGEAVWADEGDVAEIEVATAQLALGGSNLTQPGWYKFSLLESSPAPDRAAPGSKLYLDVGDYEPALGEGHARLQEDPLVGAVVTPYPGSYYGKISAAGSADGTRVYISGFGSTSAGNTRISTFAADPASGALTKLNDTNLGGVVTWHYLPADDIFVLAKSTNTAPFEFTFTLARANATTGLVAMGDSITYAFTDAYDPKLLEFSSPAFNTGNVRNLYIHHSPNVAVSLVCANLLQFYTNMTWITTSKEYSLGSLQGATRCNQILATARGINYDESNLLGIVVPVATTYVTNTSSSISSMPAQWAALATRDFVEHGVACLASGAYQVACGPYFPAAWVGLNGSVAGWHDPFDDVTYSQGLRSLQSRLFPELAETRALVAHPRASAFYALGATGIHVLVPDATYMPELVQTVLAEEACDGVAFVADTDRLVAWCGATLHFLDSSAVSGRLVADPDGVFDLAEVAGSTNNTVAGVSSASLSPTRTVVHAVLQRKEGSQLFVNFTVHQLVGDVMTQAPTLFLPLASNSTTMHSGRIAELLVNVPEAPSAARLRWRPASTNATEYLVLDFSDEAAGNVSRLLIPIWDREMQAPLLTRGPGLLTFQYRDDLDNDWASSAEVEVTLISACLDVTADPWTNCTVCAERFLDGPVCDECAPGFFSPTPASDDELCRQTADECRDTRCLGRGDCATGTFQAAVLGGSTCDCDTGYFGNICEISAELCRNERCHGLGDCVAQEKEGNSSLWCLCTEEGNGLTATGTTCGVCPGSHVLEPLNEPSGMADSPSYTCTNCAAGHYGADCTEELPVCTGANTTLCATCRDLERNVTVAWLEDGVSVVDADDSGASCACYTAMNVTGNDCGSLCGTWDAVEAQPDPDDPTACLCPAGREHSADPEAAEAQCARACVNGEYVAADDSCLCAAGFAGALCDGTTGTAVGKDSGALVIALSGVAGGAVLIALGAYLAVQQGCFAGWRRLGK